MYRERPPKMSDANVNNTVVNNTVNGNVAAGAAASAETTMPEGASGDFGQLASASADALNTNAGVNDSTLLGQNTGGGEGEGAATGNVTSLPSEVMPIVDVRIPVCNYQTRGLRYYDEGGTIFKLHGRIVWTGVKLALWVVLTALFGVFTLIALVSKKSRKTPVAIVVYVITALLVFSVVLNAVRLSNYRKRAATLKPSHVMCQYENQIYENGRLRRESEDTAIPT